MKKHLSILCLALIIVSSLMITAPLSSIQAQDIDPYITVDKTATDYEIICGQEILMNLTVTGVGFGGPFDIMLIIDRSGTMTGTPLAAAKDAAKSFIDKLSFNGNPATSDWVGLASYSTTASLDQGLTNDPTTAKSAIDRLRAMGKTNIMASVHIAQEELATHGRDHAMNVMIVLSDGVANRWTDFETGITYGTATWPTEHTTSTLKAIEEAAAAKDAGTIVFTIGLNLGDLAIPDSEWVARDTLQQMATSLDYFFDAITPGYLEEIYAIIASYIKPAGTDLTVTDIVEDEFVIVPGSIDPTPTSVVGNTIIWEFDVLGAETRTFLYKIRPIQGLHGWYPTNVEANLTYTDHEDNPAVLWFPIPEVWLYRVCISAIELVKTADPTLIRPGDEVLYTYNVTNPGPYPLHSVNLTDDKYGKIFGPFDLAVGEERIFEYRANPTEDVTNWGNATGLDPWNYPVTALDDATVEVITECTVTFYTVPSDVGNITIVDGETYLNGESDTWDYCTTLTAIANAPTGYIFDKWEVKGNLDVLEEIGNQIEFHIACGGNITAYFKPVICTVTFYTDPSNVGNITVVGNKTYLNGESGTWDYCTTLTAIANAPAGWVFDHWIVEGNLDVLEEVGNEIEFHISCGGNLTAVFRPVICTVNFYTYPSEVGNITIGDKTYFNGDSDTWNYCDAFTAIANAPEGYVFDYWEVTGNIDVLEEVDNSIRVHIVCGGSIKAYFKPVRCTVTFYTNPSDVGNITIVGGETYLNGESGTWDYCTTLTAVANAPEGYVFDKWEVTGNLDVLEEIDNTIRFHIACGGTVKAYFKPIECTVYFYTDPQDVGNITVIGGKTYFNGDSDTWNYCDTFTAIANAPEGYEFDRWEVLGNIDIVEQTDSSITVHITCGGSIKAYFKPVECTVTFYTVPSDVGNITIVGGETYLNGESGTWDYCTTLTAVANAPTGYVFDRWEVTGNLDVLEEIENTIRFHIACGGTVKAYFTPIARGKITGGGHGYIGANGIPGGSFGFNVMWFSKDPGPKGELEYVDHTTGMKVHAHVIEYLRVWEVLVGNKPWPSRKGIFGGPCTINGEDGYTFEVYIEDNGEPGRNDVFQITLSTGYVGGSDVEPILCGNIQIHKPPK